MVSFNKKLCGVGVLGDWKSYEERLRELRLFCQPSKEEAQEGPC